MIKSFQEIFHVDGDQILLKVALSYCGNILGQGTNVKSIQGLENFNYEIYRNKYFEVSVVHDIHYITRVRKW